LSLYHLLDLLLVLSCGLEVTQRLYGWIMVRLEVLQLFKELGFLLDFSLDYILDVFLGYVFV
jgi:hypothetical protein